MSTEAPLTPESEKREEWVTPLFYWYCSNNPEEKNIDDEQSIRTEEVDNDVEPSASSKSNAKQSNGNEETNESSTGSTQRLDSSQSSKRKNLECAGIVEEKCQPNPNSNGGCLKTRVSAYRIAYL